MTFKQAAFSLHTMLIPLLVIMCCQSPTVRSYNREQLLQLDRPGVPLDQPLWKRLVDTGVNNKRVTARGTRAGKGRVKRIKTIISASSCDNINQIETITNSVCSGRRCISSVDWSNLIQLTFSPMHHLSVTHGTCNVIPVITSARRKSGIVNNCQSGVNYANLTNMALVSHVQIQHIPVVMTKIIPLHHDHLGGVNLSNLAMLPMTRVFRARSVLTPCLNIGVLNTQSVRNKTDIITNIIIEQKLDILALTETWLTTDERDQFFIEALTLPGYDFHSFPRIDNSGHGGVAVLHKSNIKIKTISQYSSKNFENCVITFILDSKPVDMIVVYRPPPSAKNHLSIGGFLEEFGTLMFSYVTSNKAIIVLGDFNFHVDTHGDRDALQFIDLLASLNLRQHVIGPTHRSGHTLDCLITRETDSFVKSTEVSDMISDHNLILSSLNFSKPIPLRTTLTTRKWRSIDISLFRQDLNDDRILSRCSSDDPSALLNTYNSSLRRILDCHAPQSDKSVLIRPQQLWFSEDLYQARCERRRLDRVMRRSKLLADKTRHTLAQKAYNNHLARAKHAHFNNKIKEAGSDSRSVYGVINSLLHKDKALKLPDHDCQQALADRFSLFFKEKIEKIRYSLPKLDNSISGMPIYPCSVVLNSLTLTNECELRKIISKSPSSSCSLDPVPSWLLKDSLDANLALIMNIINASLSSGLVPDEMKKAVVTPLLKKPGLDVNILQNYRPVSNLSFVSKSLERVVAARLSKHMCDHGLHEVLQSAYKPGHSTETALLRVHNDILTTMDDRGIVILVLLDLSAAFDTIDHDVLLQRMESMVGVKGLALSWFQSYLSHRTQSISIGQVQSLVQVLLLWGVPQGSVLGPLLFLIYILPLGLLIRQYGFGLHIYADDTQIYLAVKPISPEHVLSRVSRVEECLCEVKNWMTLNFLKLNTDKTEVLVLGTHQMLSKSPVSSISVAGTMVAVQSKPVKNLGVMFDQSLTMSAHVTSVVRSATYHLRNIGRIRKSLTTDATKKLVNALVTSRIDYCNSLLCGVSAAVLKRLQKVQNFAARLVTHTKIRDHITPVLYDLHWLPVKHRIDFKLSLMVYKALNGDAPVYISELLQRYEPTRALRSQSKTLLVIPKTRLSRAGDRSFRSYGPRLWNSLPAHVRSAESVSSFKKQLKTHLFSLAYGDR